MLGRMSEGGNSGAGKVRDVISVSWAEKKCRT